MVDKLRHRIKRSLGYTSSIPPPLLLGLAALHGYAGPEFQNSSQGLRTLCKIPDVESIDWNELVSVVDDDDENAPPVAAALNPWLPLLLLVLLQQTVYLIWKRP